MDRRLFRIHAAAPQALPSVAYIRSPMACTISGPEAVVHSSIPPSTQHQSWCWASGRGLPHLAFSALTPAPFILNGAGVSAYNARWGTPAHLPSTSIGAELRAEWSRPRRLRVHGIVPARDGPMQVAAWKRNRRLPLGFDTFHSQTGRASGTTYSKWWGMITFI